MPAPQARENVVAGICSPTIKERIREDARCSPSNTNDLAHECISAYKCCARGLAAPAKSALRPGAPCQLASRLRHRKSQCGAPCMRVCVRLKSQPGRISASAAKSTAQVINAPISGSSMLLK